MTGSPVKQLEQPTTVPGNSTMATESAARKPAETTAKTASADERAPLFYGAACGAGAGGSVLLYEVRPQRPAAKAP